MRRTNVILDEKLLEEATKLSGERTYSATINAALKELIRTLKVREGLKMMSGSGWWEGDLKEMRKGRHFEVDEDSWLVRDAPTAKPGKRSKRRRRGPR
jgi:Arc/MetJ family transcription regulator